MFGIANLSIVILSIYPSLSLSLSLDSFAIISRRRSAEKCKRFPIFNCKQMIQLTIAYFSYFHEIADNVQIRITQTIFIGIVVKYIKKNQDVTILILSTIITINIAMMIAIFM